jgi:hypothetical protein
MTPAQEDLPMSHGLEHAFDDETVYRRTDRGRAALLSRPDHLSHPALGFLARVNGFTDLRTLLDQDGGSGAHAALVIESLLQQRLIEVVPPPAPSAAPGRSGKSLAA